MNVVVVGALALCCANASAESLFYEPFEGAAPWPPLRHAAGEAPGKVIVNATAPGAGYGNSSAARLRLEFPAHPACGYSYWSYDLPQSLPVVPQVESISLRVKTNVPVSLKVAIAPYPTVQRETHHE